MLTAVKGYLFKKAVGLYLKTNGWKTVIGFIVAKLTAIVAARYPNVPQEALVEILNFVGDMLLTLGVFDRIRKNLIEAKE